MKFIGKAEAVAQQIVEAFKSGNLPKALAPIFIRRQDGVPCRKWSWGNQLLCALNGTHDARGFRQWQEAHRWVKKGSHAFDILVPLMKSITITDAVTVKSKHFQLCTALRRHPCLHWRTPKEKKCRNRMKL